MPELSINIRPCELSDIDVLMGLIARHTEYERTAFDPTGKKEKLIDALFSENKKLNCIVADVNGVVAGYATYTFDYSTWDAGLFIYLDCLYLDEDYRSYGIGNLLLEEVKAKGLQNNCVNMQWQTPDFNVRAIKFYNRIGGIGKNKVRFTLPLSIGS